MLSAPCHDGVAFPGPCGTPPVCKERCSRGVFIRGGSLNMLWDAFGFYSCKFCCAINNRDTDPHVLYIYLLIADKRHVPGTTLIGPRFLTHAACTAVSFTFFIFLDLKCKQVGLTYFIRAHVCLIDAIYRFVWLFVVCFINLLLYLCF